LTTSLIFITVPETSGSHRAVFANLGYSVSKFCIGQHFNKNVSQNLTTSLIVFLTKWTYLKKWETRLGKKRSGVQLLPDYNCNLLQWHMKQAATQDSTALYNRTQSFGTQAFKSTRCLAQSYSARCYYSISNQNVAGMLCILYRWKFYWE